LKSIIIICYKKLSFGLLLFDKIFSELFGRNVNPQFCRYRSWFEAFFYLLIGDGDGAPLKGRTTYTLKLLFESPLKENCLHITTAVGAPCERRALTHFSCCRV